MFRPTEACSVTDSFDGYYSSLKHASYDVYHKGGKGGQSPLRPQGVFLAFKQGAKPMHPVNRLPHTVRPGVWIGDINITVYGRPGFEPGRRQLGFCLLPDRKSTSTRNPTNKRWPGMVELKSNKNITYFEH